jgi:hypothetical protein
MSTRRHTTGSVLLTVLVAVVTVLLMAAPALAGPWWKLSARAAPTNLPPGGQGLIEVAADDLGDDGVSGATHAVTIKDILPQGVVVSDPAAINPHRARAGNRGSKEELSHWMCTVAHEREVTCATSLAIPAYEVFEVEIPVEAREPAGTETTLTNQASVEGGEAETGGGMVPGVSVARPIKISDEPVAFGLEEDGYQIAPEDAEGKLDTEAGSHPFQLTSTVDFSEVLEEVQEPGEPALLQPAAPGLAKNLTFSLPPGLLGNVTAAKACSELDFAALKSEGNSCPASSAIGVATVTVLEPSRTDYITKAVPLFNLEPALGEPARFGFEAVRVPVILDASVRTDGDYGVTVSVNNATEAAQVLGATVTFWGNPSSQSHDSARGWACLRGGLEAFEGEVCEPPASRSRIPFLTLPTSCTGPLSTTMQGIAWNGSPISGSFAFQGELGGALETLTGCAGLPFDASIAVAPEQPAENGHPRELVQSASTATGLEVSVSTDQHGTVTDGAPADADVQSATATLPAGMQLNPSAANGLQACSEQQVGYEGPAGVDPFEPGSPQPPRFSTAQSQCPEASKLGTVRVKTPLLGEELTGGVYLAAQEANPFGSLIALYIVAENKTLGLRVKLAGEGKLNEQTGQITTSFTSTPQVPFETLTVNFFGGANGSLATPAHCGTYTTTASFTSWTGALLDTEAQPPFAITTGPGGTPCPAAQLPFTPSFNAGSTNLQAGAFTPFTLTLDNPDADQPLTGLSVHLPSGVAAMLAGVTPCPEPAAGQAWACGPDSLIGHSVAQSGLGGSPVSLPGSAYLTVGYEGAPFGILVVTPAVAGPFNLGDVDVRSKILVDENTAAVTIVSDPFPLFVRGVPVDLKQIQVMVDRPEFEFNPTHCTPQEITATLTGAESATAAGASRFQVDGCASLPFKPTLTASTQGKTSKVDGASLTVKVTSSSGQANIAKTVVTLPEALPSRLSTLQLACLAKTFQENPASCPEGSFIGTATVHTPVLKSPLTGPAILVSHGGEAFPDVEFLLQGEGILLVLDGKTHIKNGVTTSSFNTVPDAPVTSFETVLPEGPHSILGAISDLCTSKLVMPTVMTAQNGAVLEKNTPVTVTGCSGVKASKTKRLSQAQKRGRALAACRKKYPHSTRKRSTCEHAARRRYPAKTSSHHKPPHTTPKTKT